MSFYVSKKFKNLEELRGILNGPPVPDAFGTQASTSVGSPNLGVPLPSASGEADFTDVVPGDRIIVQGEVLSTIFLVVSKTNDQNIVLDNNFTANRVGVGVWRTLRYADRVPLAKIQFGGPIHGPSPDQGFVVYDAS
jgi:hypothetical protein